jgi:hypothetical protein
MNLLIVIFVLIIIIFYLQCYFKMPLEYNLLQTTIKSFKQDLLYEKQPIYIYDKLVNPADLFNTIFKYTYMYHTLSLSDSRYTKKNLSKFLIIYNDTDDTPTTISISHPKSVKSDFLKSRFLKKHYKISNNHIHDNTIDVIVRPQNCIIVPMHWVYRTNLDNILEIHLHDVITSISSFLL